MYVYGACLFYICCSELWGNVCCVAAVLKNSGCFYLGVLKHAVCLCSGCDGCCVLCLYCEAWSCRCSYGKCECFVMQMLYVCVLGASCGSSQSCVLHDLQLLRLVEDPRGNHMEEAYSRAGLITAL